MASAEGEKKLIVLKSSDGEEFQVEEAVAMESQTLRHMIEDDCAENGIPLLNVTSNILAKVIEYCNKHIHDTKSAADTFNASPFGAGEDLKNWDLEFVKAANYLGIKGLLDLTCQTVADMTKGKSPEEIREMFNIKNDLTPEEEEEIRKENVWAFE
ncbi:hypothetical protein U9M48_008937 [Paspalum notatum var. saurae]|uniref:SKP1-like protein n=1 Tax=Paspalum notatum var. saurae TaxID=547442 RepID=A0AAQ3SQ61_PASNO